MTDSIDEVPRTFCLADHLRACVVGDRVILLDLRRDRYFALQGQQARVVAQVIRADTCPSDPKAPRTVPFESSSPTAGVGYADTDDHGSRRRRTHQAGDQMAPLIKAGILTNRPAFPVGLRGNAPLQSATLSIDGASQRDAGPETSGSFGPFDIPALRLPDVYRVAQATVQAAFCLRFRSLGAIARSLQIHRRRRGIAEGADLRPVRQAAAVFGQLRPWLFTARDHCLLDSLALMLFLTHRRLPARWVIGVADRPFRAHAWVQARELVLNDLHDHVRRFTPILVV